MKKNTSKLLTFLFVVFVSAGLQAQVVTKTVDDNTDGTLRNEIADAGIGGTVTFDPSIAGQTINVTQGPIEVGTLGNISIEGLNGESRTTIAGTSSNRIFNIDATVASIINLSDLNFTSGTASSGGAIQVSGATTVLNLNNTDFTGNTATGNAATEGGGAIFNNGAVVNVSGSSQFESNAATGTAGSGGAILNSSAGVLSIDGATFNLNSSQRAGGAIEDNANSGAVIVVDNSTFSSNNAGSSPGNGGALHITGSSSYTFNGGLIDANIAGKEGGGLWNGSGVLTINGATISNNDAQGDLVPADATAGTSVQIVGGGGIFANDGPGSVVINEGTIISNNVATGVQGSGGGILMATGTTLTINGSGDNPVEINNNSASRAGGGIEDWSLDANANTLTNVNFSGNTAGADATGFTANGGPGNGGAIHVTGPGDNVITGGTVDGNTAANEGGGFWNGSGTMSVSGTTITNNIAAGNDTEVAGAAGGGGLFNEGGTLNVTNNTTVSNNSATGAQSTGGGILNAAGVLVVSDSEISGNESNRAGGGIETNGDSSVELNNVTLDSNFTGVVTGMGAPGNGGGLHVSGAAPVTINGGTVNNNIAAKEGGGLWNNQGVMTINGTTISGNDARGDLVPADATAGTSVQIVGGGGIFAEDGNGSVVINEGTVIANNVATGVQGSGGGILMATGTTLTINGSEASPVEINNNSASRAGGGIEDWSLSANENTMTNVNFSGNTVGVDATDFTANGGPGNGGAIHVTGPGDNVITGGTVDGNTAANEGGGFWNGSGTMSVSGTTIINNIAAGNDTEVAGAAGGGGLFNEGGTLNVTNNTTVSNNSATGAQSTGGGILNAAGVLVVSDSEISSNESNRAGGGIETNGESSVELNNVTLDSNFTGVVTGMGAPGNGGGLHVSGAAPVTINGGTVNNNIAAKEGGGLWNNQGVMTINGTTISSNDARGDLVPADATAGTSVQIVGGGGIFAEDGAGSVVINEGTVISNNMATGVQGSGGGILMATGTTLTINGSEASPVEINNNSASRAGGGIEDWTLDTNSNTLTNVNFTGNSVGLDVDSDSDSDTGFTANGGPGNGGAIHVTGPGSNTITNASVDGNLAAAEGGGFWNGSGTMTVSDSDFNANIASGDAADNGGGALFNNGGTMNIENVEATGNLANGASGSGGAFFSTNGLIEMENVSFTGNSANRAGGAIEVIDGQVNINNSDISGNDVNGTAGTAAPGNGGALHISGSTDVTIENSTINNNVAASEGGALWNQRNSTLTVINSTLDGNSTEGTAADTGGGAIFNNGGDTEVLNSTISNNTSASNGGGISNQEGDLTVDLSTIAQNEATLDGGGIYNAGSSATLRAVTVGRNTAGGTGGGLASDAGIFTINSTLVAENEASSDFNVSRVTSADYNLIEIDDLGSFTAMSNDIVGSVEDPEFGSLGELQDNGGDNFTLALLNGTRAQDAGDPSLTFNDQIGQANFGARDIGSFESQATLSIDEVGSALAGLRLYPNPSIDGQVSIELPVQLDTTASYQVIDMTGKQIQANSLQSGVNNLQLGNLATGIYIVRINAANQSQSLKLIKK
ncbi:beta strand repeat-containing protein [Nonlabens ponticola]|uniref:T9SS type A sorting domain-containing protein n=1 Tax=Nonlabens ponticola TaxID=2496866 RepID=A0A3S9MZ00_9FLAO|nr:T9SS type A sorting domain-containing protein [Nonlabens ponticola]AZQ44283.1 T9SS type A sorting domain-containing protein [Nonlabens ponticola]